MVDERESVAIPVVIHILKDGFFFGFFFLVFGNSAQPTYCNTILSPLLDCKLLEYTKYLTSLGVHEIFAADGCYLSFIYSFRVQQHLFFPALALIKISHAFTYPRGLSRA